MPRFNHVPTRQLARRASPALGLALAVTTCATSILSGCQSDRTGQSSAALIPIAGCTEALDFVRQVALERMNREIDEAIELYEKGEGCNSGNWLEDGVAYGPTAGAPAPSRSAGGGERASQSSGTNNQVASVDEADFVKNDGKYIYLAQNGVLRIIDGYPGAEARELSRVDIHGQPKKLFVEGDRALVYVSTAKPAADPDQYTYYGGECTYGYDCQFTGDGTATRLLVFDISDRSAPRKLREVFLSGSLIAARRIGNTTHTVVADNTQLFPEVSTYPESQTPDLCDYFWNHPDRETFWSSEAWVPPLPPTNEVVRARAAYEALRLKNRDVILSKDLSGVLPRLADSSDPSAELTDGPQLCDSLYRSRLLDGASFTTLVSLDMASSAPARTATIVSSAGAVYAADTGLYLAVPSEQGYSGGWYSGWESTNQLSTIHKFRIGAQAGETGYIGSGVVRGRVLNQFAMDERNGHLRIATTSGHVPDPDVESQLTVLAERDRALEKVGSIDHIAPSEDIRSVRFDGDRGFIVTFKKTDPLFVLDLANPAAPRTLGELKIPGFSTYMHMLDDRHILSIGYDADDHGDFAYFDGVLLQIFDISDPSNPRLAHRHVIGTRGSSSEALTNHLAFNYFQPLGLLAVPMTICEGGDDGTFGDRMTFSGLLLFNIDAQSGISEKGRVAHPLPVVDPYGYGEGEASCSNWWSQAGSDVQRSIFMDRYVYSISNDLMKIQTIDALGRDLRSLDLTSSQAEYPEQPSSDPAY